jgi:hypothetical protein
MAKQRESAAPAAVMHLAKPRWQAKSRATPRVLLPASSRVMRRVLLQANSRVKTAAWRPPLLGLPVKVMLLVQQPAKPPLLESHVHLKDSRLRRGMEIPLVRAHAHQYLRGPGPFAFFRETPDAEKCNPAARCGDLPIFARYHRRCNRRGFVGYGNTRSRLLHKHVRPAGTFPIVAADKCPSPLRRIQD